MIAACVGTILFEFATNVPSLENSLITTAEPPTCMPPKLSSVNPDKLNVLALTVTTPELCST